jgi:hypothetical protein
MMAGFLPEKYVRGGKIRVLANQGGLPGKFVWLQLMIKDILMKIQANSKQYSAKLRGEPPLDHERRGHCPPLAETLDGVMQSLKSERNASTKYTPSTGNLPLFVNEFCYLLSSASSPR